MMNEAIDFKILLLDHYKELKLSENEVTTVLMIDHLMSQHNALITADLLALKMSLNVAEIDKILSDLFTRGLLQFVTKGKKTKTSLEPLKKKLYEALQKSLEFEEHLNCDDEAKAQITDLISNFNTLLGRTLSPIEEDKLGDWLNSGYKPETIINALKDCLNAGKKNLRNVDKILLNYKARDDIESEGHSSIDNNWDKSLEETIRIAKTPWLKK